MRYLCHGVLPRPQSAWTAVADDASHIARLGNIMFTGGAIILAAVVLLTVLAISARSAWRGAISSERMVVWGGIVFPVVTLTVLLVMACRSPARWVARRSRRISASKLRGSNSGGASTTRKLMGSQDLRPPTRSTSRTVELVLASPDVIHSFWVPNIAGKLDMIPGQQNRMAIRASEPVVARGQCAEFCGMQHANMSLYLVARPEADFAGWLAAQRAEATQNAESERGRVLCLSAGSGSSYFSWQSLL